MQRIGKPQFCSLKYLSLQSQWIILRSRKNTFNWTFDLKLPSY